VGKGGKDKTPKYAKEPEAQKKPKFEDKKVKGAPLSWRFSHHDREGPFQWSKVFENGDLQEVMIRLASVEGLAEHELAQDGSHPIELHKLCKEAQDRLTHLRHDDLDTVFSLRISGPKRLYCIHHGNIMRVLWYDPDHQICPSPKKHT
jgi:hypothetical protein